MLGLNSLNLQRHSHICIKRERSATFLCHVITIDRSHPSCQNTGGPKVRNTFLRVLQIVPLPPQKQRFIKMWISFWFFKERASPGSLTSCIVYRSLPVWTLGAPHLFVGDVDGSAEDDPLHHLTAGGRGQRAGVTIVTPQRGRQHVLQHEGLQEGLFFYRERGRTKCSDRYLISTALVLSGEATSWMASRRSCFIACSFVLLIPFVVFTVRYWWTRLHRAP